MNKKINEKEIEEMNKKFPTGHYDRKGKTIGLGTWAKLLEDKKYSIVEQKEVKIGKKVYFVSSVWLGIDYAFEDEKKPVIFETMIFKRNNIKELLGDDIYQDRYCTEQQAIAGHKKAIRLLKAGKICNIK